MADSASASLQGVWAAQPIAWDEHDEFDPGAYESDIAYLCSSGVHGVYSGGTTGEFYAIDFAEFVATNSVMLRTAHQAGVPVQVGVTAMCTREVVRRTRWAAQHGADGVQVALPSWLPLDDDEVVTFFGDVAEVAGSSYIVHYDTMRAKRTISPQLLLRVRGAAANLVGAKYSGGLEFIPQVLEAAPGYVLFTGETELYEALRLGARGTYSSIVLTNPKLMLDFYQACVTGDDTVAQAIAARIERFSSEVIEPIYAGVTEGGLWDSAIDRLQAVLNPNMRCGLRCRRPYRSATQADLYAVKGWIERNDPDLIWTREGWTPHCAEW